MEIIVVACSLSLSLSLSLGPVTTPTSSISAFDPRLINQPYIKEIPRLARFNRHICIHCLRPSSDPVFLLCVSPFRICHFVCASLFFVNLKGAYLTVYTRLTITCLIDRCFYSLLIIFLPLDKSAHSWPPQDPCHLTQSILSMIASACESRTSVREPW